MQLEGEIKPDPQLLPSIMVHQQERRRGKFSGSLTLPAAVNIKSARATYQRGILEIRLAKLPGHQGEALRLIFLNKLLVTFLRYIGCNQIGSNLFVFSSTQF
ncbi:hypothetical protein MGLY_17020 [Neomoorella glycerini]|uniref:SHSP domain-containing protein n=1 Tax=Neomoorella glycerini TaxID=55779 RepID=A0A6I5ZRF8_9FIRM|nr:hypothetical protein MGLY_17020 [Moorella glycerini]